MGEKKEIKKPIKKVAEKKEEQKRLLTPLEKDCNSLINSMAKAVKPNVKMYAIAIEADGNIVTGNAGLSIADQQAVMAQMQLQLIEAVVVNVNQKMLAAQAQTLTANRAQRRAQEKIQRKIIQG